MRVDLERQVIDPLAEIGALSLKLVLRFVDLPAKLAHLIFQRIHPGQKLGDDITAAVLRRRLGV